MVLLKVLGSLKETLVSNDRDYSDERLYWHLTTSGVLRCSPIRLRDIPAIPALENTNRRSLTPSPPFFRRLTSHFRPSSATVPHLPNADQGGMPRPVGRGTSRFPHRSVRTFQVSDHARSDGRLRTRPGSERRYATRNDSIAEGSSCTSCAIILSVLGPKVVLIATSAASRPLATSTRPIRGILLRASNVYQWPPTKASNQALKSIGAGSAGTPMSPK
jgi:hypothetical protein